METWQNQLYFGDNLDILRNYIPDESVDLIYLDPPFNSNATYNVLFAEKSGESSTAQITAFEDTWHWGLEAEHAFKELVTSGPVRLSQLMDALRRFLGQNDMMAYLVMMAIRLVELHRVLKPTGSLYLHCDPTASHYLKLVLDHLFGPKMFRNEIIWKRTSGHSDARRFGRIHDVIFYYTKSVQFRWNQTYQAYDHGYIEQYYRYKDPDGRRWMSADLGSAGLVGGGYEYEWRGVKRVWRCPQSTMERLEKEGRIFYTRNNIPRLKRYLDETEGMPAQDVWTDIQPVRSWHKERLEYPTQKPEALLDRIIRTSSNEGDVVLDPFCGCGTATVVAERLRRRWIGIDITHLAITLIKKRLHDTFGDNLSPYQIIGAPQDWSSAAALAEHNRHQFEWWALSLVEARPAQDKRKGPDRGVDGYIYFFDDNSGKAKKIVVQVKSGQVSVAQVRDLLGVVEREQAVIGVFLTLKEPSRQMLAEAAAAGFYEPEHLPGRKYPRLQIRSIADLLAGKELEYPKYAPATFKKAPRQHKGLTPEESQGNLLSDTEPDLDPLG